MCNTLSNVCLQFMKTYTLSVNTLMWNFILERHDNCVTCPGLILPIRWVTPPPNFSEDFIWRHNCFIFTPCLSSTLFVFKTHLLNVGLIGYLWHIYVLSSTKFTYRYAFKLFTLSERDQTLFLSMLYLSNSLYLFICILLTLVECLHYVLVSWRYRDTE